MSAARAVGALGQLPLVLAGLDATTTWAGDLTASATLVAESGTVCEATGAHASQVRPELPLIAALADALGAELRIVPQGPEARRAAREHGRPRRVADAG